MPLLRRHAWLLTWFVPVAAVLFLWTHNDSVGWFANDGPSYLLMARHYAWHGVDTSVSAAAAYSRFPPLYPVLLAWLGTGGSLPAIHAVTTAFLLAALLLQYAWLGQAGLPPGQRALAGLMSALLPGTWLAGLVIQPEYLYLLWSMLALALLAAHRRGGDDRLLYGAALAVAAAALTRTVGITLLAPLLLACRGQPRRAQLLVLAAAVLPLLAWYGSHDARGNGYGDTLLASYGHAPLATLLEQVGAMLPALDRGFADNLVDGGVLRPLALLWGIVCLAAALWRAFRLEPDGVYVAVHFLLLLVWPFPGETQRLTWVLLPVLLAQPLLVGAPAGRLRKLVPAGAAAVVLALSLPVVMQAAGRWSAAASLPGARGFLHWYTGPAETARLHVGAEMAIIEALRRIPQHVTENECVLAVRPDLVNYFGQRRSTYPPLPSVAEPRFDAELRNSGCPVMMVTRFADTTYPQPMYPLPRLTQAIDVLDYVDLDVAPPAPPQTFYLLARF